MAFLLNSRYFAVSAVVVAIAAVALMRLLAPDPVRIGRPAVHHVAVKKLEPECFIAGTLGEGRIHYRHMSCLYRDGRVVETPIR